MECDSFDKKFDLVVVGGGLPGIIGAIAAARMGVKTALINDRGYIGGNAGAEIGVGSNGADGMSEFNFNSREMGLHGEMIIANLHRNPQGNKYHWDSFLMDYIEREENLECFMNTYVDKATVENGKIISVSGVQNTTEKRYTFLASYFLDDTGDGTLGYLAGAEYRMGREAKSEFHESIALDEADEYTMLATLMFRAEDTGKPVKYRAPSFALDIEKCGILKNRVIPPDRFMNQAWYYEIGGKLNQIFDAEEILKQHRALTYGIWDYIKNSGKYPSENYDLKWVSCVPGKRESRRLMGDYILTQNDIVERKDFDDAVAYGGWSIDLHSIMGVYGDDPVNGHYYLDGIYQIPYRCFYSKNIENLFMAGRCMSTTHVGYGTTRVISTLSLGGNVAGLAAYLCKKYATTPRGIYQNHLKELKQLLIEQDMYLFHEKWENEKDLARKANINASSYKQLCVTGTDSFFQLDKDIAVTVPIEKFFEKITFLVRAKEDSALSYQVHISKKKEGYNPDILIKEGKINVTKGANKVDLAVDSEIDCQYALVTLLANEKIEVGGTNDKISCITTVNRTIIGFHPQLLDASGKNRDFVWHKVHHFTPWFQVMPAQEVFAPKNVTNGYFRPHGNPNIWLSDDKVFGEWLEIELPEEKDLTELVITFDADLDHRVVNLGKSDHDVLVTIVKDYKVYVKSGRKYQLAAEMEDNYTSVNKIDLKGLRGDRVKMVFEATNGAKRVGVYGVKLF